MKAFFYYSLIWYSRIPVDLCPLKRLPLLYQFLFFLQGIYFAVPFIPFDNDYPFQLLSFDHTVPLILGSVP